VDTVSSDGFVSIGGLGDFEWSHRGKEEVDSSCRGGGLHSTILWSTPEQVVDVSLVAESKPNDCESSEAIEQVP
jgi:hypothetical protein